MEIRVSLREGCSGWVEVGEETPLVPSESYRVTVDLALLLRVL